MTLAVDLGRKATKQTNKKIDKTKVLTTNGSLMQVKSIAEHSSLMKVQSIAECSLGEFCNTFDMH